MPAIPISAKARAEKTIRELIREEGQQSQPEEHAEVTAKAAAIPDTPASPQMEDAPPPISMKREPGEDLIEYINRLPIEVFTAPQAGIYIYKQSQTGNVQLDKIFRPITFDELKNIYAGRYGAGNYYLQFNTRDKRLNSGGQRFTFDGSTLQSLGGGSTEALGGAALTSGAQATSEAIKMVAEASREANKANIELITEITKNAIKPTEKTDVAAIITAVVGAITAMKPSGDGDSSMIKLLEAQRKDAEDRVRQAREDADRREARIKEETQAARERDQQFFTMMKSQSDNMNAILLKQAENKTDSLNQMTGLLSNFIKVKNEIDDSLGGGPKGPWDLVGSVAERVADMAPGIIAAYKGAPPAAVAQAMNPRQEPQEPQPFYDLVIRLAKYFQRDPAKYNGPYLVDVIEAEYGAVYSEIANQPKEMILESIGQFDPWGKAIMEHQVAADFMGRIIDAIKSPDDIDSIFPDPDEEPEIIQGKVERPPLKNGRAKVERAR